MLLSRPKPPQAGAKGQPLQGYSSQRQLPPKVSGPPLAAASTPGRRAESTASACEITHSKFKRAGDLSGTDRIIIYDDGTVTDQHGDALGNIYDEL